MTLVPWDHSPPCRHEWGGDIPGMARVAPGHREWSTAVLGPGMCRRFRAHVPPSPHDEGAVRTTIRTAPRVVLSEGEAAHRAPQVGGHPRQLVDGGPGLGQRLR